MAAPARCQYGYRGERRKVKPETLGDLISGKHPPTDALWLSSPPPPGLLEHSTKRIKKSVPCVGGGSTADRLWAPEVQ